VAGLKNPCYLFPLNSFSGAAAVTRLVLVDHENRVRGDTAAIMADSAEWALLEDDIRSVIASPAELAIRAARLVDRRHGRICRAYGFTAFAANNADGYFVFNCDAHRAPPAIVDDGDDLAATAAVMTACFYLGFVSRRC